MLTVQQLQPTVTNVDELLKTGQSVGYGRGSYIKGVLEDLGFDKSKIKPYDTLEDFHSALSKGSKSGDSAAFVSEIPYIKLFLAEHCKGYTMVGPIYKTAGFGYVSSTVLIKFTLGYPSSLSQLYFSFTSVHHDSLSWGTRVHKTVYLLPQALQKGSPIIGGISQAILNITGGDTIIQIEKKWIGDQNNCQNVGTISGTGSLSFDSFAGLIIATGVASTTSLMVALIIYFCKNKQVGSENGDSEQIMPQEENKDSGDEEKQRQEAAGARGMHEQINKVMHNGSLVICTGERIRSSWVSSSSARF